MPKMGGLNAPYGAPCFLTTVIDYEHYKDGMS